MKNQVQTSDKKRQMESKKKSAKLAKKRRVKKLFDSSDEESPKDKGEKKRKKEDSSLNHSKKRKKKQVTFDYRLDDDDYDLIEENVGAKIKRQRFKRVQKFSDSESDADDSIQTIAKVDSNIKVSIAEELFGGDSNEDEDQNKKSDKNQELSKNITTLCDKENSSDGESSGVDDFIVHDVPIMSDTQKDRVCSNSAYREAQEIFGTDFDYEEFKQRDEDEDDEAEEDGELSLQQKVKQGVKSIFDVYEPIEFKRAYYTDRDQEIRCKDLPERMQERLIPVTPVSNNSDELNLEAHWIYQQAFDQLTISDQTMNISGNINDIHRKCLETVDKIKNALEFIRNQNFEVSFIAFYRKEYVLPELTIKDLWKVYEFDGKWCQMYERKKKLLNLFKNMQDYLMSKIKIKKEASGIRTIDDKYIMQLENAQTNDELNDFHHHLMLYYRQDIPEMQEIMSRIEAEKSGSPSEDSKKEEVKVTSTRKKAVKSGSYAVFKKFGFENFTKKFGLSSLQFAENVQDNYQHHKVHQAAIHPNDLAKEFIGETFKTIEDVFRAAQTMMAVQLSREPLLRKCVRMIYMERAKLTVRPTKKGIKEIDESHPLYTMQYLKEKPVRELVGDQWLKLVIAEKDKLITIQLSDIVEGNSSDNYIDEMRQLFIKNNNSDIVQEWNKLRANSVEDALLRLVIPDLKKELRNKLLVEAKSFAMNACCQKLHDWINVAPIVCEFPDKKDDEDWDTKHGARIMGIAYVPDCSQAAFACIVSPSGECKDHLKLPHLLKRKNYYYSSDGALKDEELRALTNFISKNKPHAVVIGGESKEALHVSQDVTQCIAVLFEEEDYPMIKVEISDSNVAKIYANTKGAIEFPSYPPQLREAISLARRLQNPLGEFSQLCNSDNDLLCLKFHPLQDSLSKEELINNLYTEFINTVNAVGVDINENRGYTESLLQFVNGLGPRKSRALLKIIKSKNQKLESREQLVTVCHMGPKVYINCAGFIKIDTDSFRYNSESHIQVLDSTRIHPETYKLAAKMAFDALEYDEDNDDTDMALEDILKVPKKLLELDLDAFAKELELRGFGKMLITLNDVLTEINSPYKDPRTPYTSPNAEQLFDMLTKETPETLYVGKLVSATVIGIGYKKPAADQPENQLNPVQSEKTGLWTCPYCSRADFLESYEVLEHFNTEDCLKTVSKIKIRLENNLNAFILVQNLSDKYIDDPEKIIIVGSSFQCRVIAIHAEKFLVECSHKRSDVLDLNNELRPTKDPYYDTEAELEDKKIEEDRKKAKQQVSIKRVNYHPSFQNVSFAKAEKLMKDMAQGEVIIRPGSRGLGYLSATWKVAEEIYQHVAIKEANGFSIFSLGKSLWIEDEEFEDLDEIIAKYINPMATYASKLLNFKYYQDGIDGLKTKAEDFLKKQKEKTPKKIPYIISASKNQPGKFLLSCLINIQCHHEHITVTPDGLSFKGEIFQRVSDLIQRFKDQFKNHPVNKKNKKITYLISADDFGSVIDHQSHPKLTPTCNSLAV
ncbi:transcription elongation factor SPT6-like [Cotesia glomerata]|uniref:transcription elongation factor SPT6-like n=1 Tax=Cotesia glomerata TaxID=32391 RepID=UPI001D02FFFE|nr:transcription elongation factor SPT6-like [Cotesia glomerata]